MTALHAQPQPGEPLIPMPALTPDALRAAVEELTPSRMPAFVRDLVDATTSAQRAQSLAPLRTFVHTWGVFVAIQRYPSRAARLRHLENVVSGGVVDPADAITEIRKIHADAEAEAGLAVAASSSSLPYPGTSASTSATSSGTGEALRRTSLPLFAAQCGDGPYIDAACSVSHATAL